MIEDIQELPGIHEKKGRELGQKLVKNWVPQEKYMIDESKETKFRKNLISKVVTRKILNSSEKDDI